MLHLNVAGKVDLKRNEPTPYKKHAIAQISDDTGKIWLALWRDQVDQVQVGDTILLTDAFTRRDRGRFALHTWQEIIPRIDPQELISKKS